MREKGTNPHLGSVKVTGTPRIQVGNDEITNGNNDELIQKLLMKYEWLVNSVVADNQLNDVKVLPQ